MLPSLGGTSQDWARSLPAPDGPEKLSQSMGSGISHLAPSDTGKPGKVPSVPTSNSSRDKAGAPADSTNKGDQNSSAK